MGGQVAVEGGLHLDMRGMNQLVWLRAPQRQVRVQAGMRWRDLQVLIDPQGMAQVLREHDVEALNVSIRHSPADADSLLPWAKEEVFSFVLYHKQRTHSRAQKAVGEWTRVLFDLVLRCEGRYHLPYQLHATRQRFDQAYPEAKALRELKQRVDSRGVLSNELWAKYL